MESGTADPILTEYNFKQYKSTAKLKISPHYLKQLYEKNNSCPKALALLPKSA